MQDVVNRGAFPPFFEVHTSSVIRGYHPREIVKMTIIAVAFENYRAVTIGKVCDSSWSQSNNFGVSRKRFRVRLRVKVRPVKMIRPIVMLSMPVCSLFQSLSSPPPSSFFKVVLEEVGVFLEGSSPHTPPVNFYHEVT